jgi:plastocyanin
MRKLILVPILIFALSLAACGGGHNTSGSPTLSMSTSTFSGSTAITMKVGATLTLSDQTDGATHILATGTNGSFTAEAGAPSNLNAASGLTINPGQSVSITFTTPGTYHITCLVHPGMNATITVQ